MVLILIDVCVNKNKKKKKKRCINRSNEKKERGKKIRRGQIRMVF